MPRDNLYRAQTPQGFRFADILAAHRDHAARDVTDDVEIAALAGIKVEAVAGEETQFESDDGKGFRPGGNTCWAAKRVTAMGYDAHRFSRRRSCLAVRREDCRTTTACTGHSDADAGLHALTDAILGCIGAGDIGQHFPPSDERWRGAPSWKFLDHAAALVAEKGGRILHCDVTLICERPKIGPHREAMRGAHRRNSGTRYGHGSA